MWIDSGYLSVCIHYSLILPIGWKHLRLVHGLIAGKELKLLVTGNRMNH
jgi:hypothetical protein